MEYKQYYQVGKDWYQSISSFRKINQPGIQYREIEPYQSYSKSENSRKRTSSKRRERKGYKSIKRQKKNAIKQLFYSITNIMLRNTLNILK